MFTADRSKAVYLVVVVLWVALWLLSVGLFSYFDLCVILLLRLMGAV